LIDSQNLLISYPSTPSTELISMQRSTLLACYACTEFRRRSFLIEGHNLSHFWEQLHTSLGTHLSHSSDYHPQKDGQTERVNQILGDMLKACVMVHSGSWDKNLSWAEFSYNNSYQESLKMTPFEAIYGQQCCTPLNWIELGEKAIFGSDIVDEAERMVRHIQGNLKAAKSR
jgi:hypothetical protein